MSYSTDWRELDWLLDSQQEPVNTPDFGNTADFIRADQVPVMDERHFMQPSGWECRHDLGSISHSPDDCSCFPEPLQPQWHMPAFVPGHENGLVNASLLIENQNTVLWQNQQIELLHSWPRGQGINASGEGLPPGLPRRRSVHLSSAGRKTNPVPMPTTQQDRTPDPMQRWRNSPPEAEGASLAAIERALRAAGPPVASCNSYTTSSVDRAASTFSRRSSGTRASSRSASSNQSASSAADYNSRSRTVRRRVGGKVTKRRPFQCTFCCDSFRTKYDWSRHETSLHLSVEKWVCSPFGSVVVSPLTGRSHCAYCHMLDPNAEHLATHNHEQCQASTEPHIFTRKDHLVQHLRHFHQVDTLPVIDDWKIEAPPLTSRCGFCDLVMATWQQRTDHLSNHFREGKTMSDWRGDHGFEPSIASQVANALPPYALSSESQSFAPYSATSPYSRDHILQFQRMYEERQASYGEDARPEPLELGMVSVEEPRQTELSRYEAAPLMGRIECLTLGLGRYARRLGRQGIIPTDEMFQCEARRLTFGNEDGWEQTIADNSEWLTSFRERHGQEEC